MANKRRSRKPGKRKYTYRRKSYKRKSMQAKTSFIGRGLSPVADNTRVRLKYSERFQNTMTAGTYVNDVFRGNGPRDPWYASGGASALGYTIWSTFYNQVVCTGSRFSMRVLNNGSTPATSNLEIGLIPTMYSTLAVSSLNSFIAGQYGKYNLLGFGAGSKRLSSYMTTDKIWGLTNKKSLMENDFSCAVGSDPVNQWFWNVYFRPIDNSSTTTVDVYVEIEYDLLFYDRVSIIY